MKEHLAKIEAYGKAHWKELLALVLAAIPAGFLIFHKGTQQAAANAISYIPAAFGAGDSGATPGSGGPGGDPGSQLAAAVGITTQPSSTILGTSVNGSSTTSSPSIPKTGSGTTAPSAPAAVAKVIGTIGSGGGSNTTGRSSGTQINGGAAPLYNSPVASGFAAISSGFLASLNKAVAASKTVRAQARPAPPIAPAKAAQAPSFNPIKSRSSGTQAL